LPGVLIVPKVDNFAEMADDMLGFFERLDVELHRENHKVAAKALKDKTPRGHTGHMKRSWGSVAPGESRKRPLGDIGAGVRPGAKSRIVSDDTAAPIVDLGRGAHNKHGSPKAPNGIVRPALGVVAGRQPQIRVKAWARTIARVGR
jgi:hypothetical protein